MKNNKHIDIVITWVNMNNDFLKEKNYWLNKENESLRKKHYEDEKIRFIDNEELRYALRSIEMYFPHFRHIYLVVKDDQFPSYIKKNHPKLKIIKESKIVPTEYLPTFNCMVIEQYIHHIPGLSDNYLYMNDDFMFLKQVDKSYFIDDDNKPYSLHKDDKFNFDNPKYKVNLDRYHFLAGYTFNNNILNNIIKKEPGGRYTVLHVPKMFNRTNDYKIENEFKHWYALDYKTIKRSNTKVKNNLYHISSKSKFRKNNNLYLVSVLKKYLYNGLYGSKFKKTDELFIPLDKDNKITEYKINFNKYFLCISMVGENNKYKYFNFMNKLFPRKSSFEI